MLRAHGFERPEHDQIERPLKYDNLIRVFTCHPSIPLLYYAAVPLGCQVRIGYEAPNHYRSGLLRFALLDRVAPINCQRVADNEARARTAQPKNGGSDFCRLSDPFVRLISQDLFHRFGFLGQHLLNHRRVDSAGANRIDADASRSIFERGALRQPQYPVLRGVIDRSPRYADESAYRRIVYDRAALLLAHLQQFVLQAVPDALDRKSTS